MNRDVSPPDEREAINRYWREVVVPWLGLNRGPGVWRLRRVVFPEGGIIEVESQDDER